MGTISTLLLPATLQKRSIETWRSIVPRSKKPAGPKIAGYLHYDVHLTVKNRIPLAGDRPVNKTPRELIEEQFDGGDEVEIRSAAVKIPGVCADEDCREAPTNTLRALDDDLTTLHLCPRHVLATVNNSSEDIVWEVTKYQPPEIWLPADQYDSLVLDKLVPLAGVLPLDEEDDEEDDDE